MGRIIPFRRRRSPRVPLAILALAALASVVLPDRNARADTGAAVRVVDDGDTLWLGEEKIRIFGIDAPELDQTCGTGRTAWDCGRWSADVLRSAVAPGITCEGRDRDRYGRLLATCTADGRDLGEAMVAAGAATAYVRYSDAYSDIEAFARAKEAGIWAGPMQEPEAFRRAAPRAQAAAGGCTIKGNITANGRIYHVPGQENYDKTRIDPRRGEAWFCSAAEAEAAGFRAARR